MKHSKTTLSLLIGACLLALTAVGWADNCKTEAKQGKCGMDRKTCEVSDKKCPVADKEKCELKKAQTTCPVTGEKIHKDLYVDHDGKRIYVCCRGCEAKVEKNFEKYEKKLEDEGVNLTAPEKKESETDA